MGIKVTRGDTLALAVDLAAEDGSSYELQPGDTLTLTVKKSTGLDEPVLVQKRMTSETGAVTRLGEEDTSLAYGAYAYDVELRTAGGDVCTVVGPDWLVIGEEVTTNG